MFVDPAIGQSGNRAVRQSGSQAIGQSGNRAVRQSGSQAIRQSEGSKWKFSLTLC